MNSLLDIGNIGLDFGSSCFVLTINHRLLLEILLNESSLRETCNIISFTEKEILFGDQSFMKLRSNYQNTIISPIRYINPNLFESQSDLSKELKFQTCKLEPTKETILFKVKFMNEEKTFDLLLINALILSFLHCKIVKSSKFLFFQYNYVISVSSYQSPESRNSILLSSKIGNINTIKLLNESSALSLVYRKNHEVELIGKPPKKVIFIDIGHSKTVIILSTIHENWIQINNEVYDPFLGVRELDWLLFEYYEKKIIGENLDLKNNKKASLRVMEAIEKQRKVLSTINEASINIESLSDDYDLNYIMKRDEFENIILPCLERFKLLLLRFKTEIEIKYNSFEYDEIELIGGGIRIPIFQKIISDFLPFASLSKTLNSTECISMGCSIYAGFNNIFQKADFKIQGVNEILYNAIYYKGKNNNEISVFQKGTAFPCYNAIPIIIKIDEEYEIYYKDLCFNERNGLLYKFCIENESEEKNDLDTFILILQIDFNGEILIKNINPSNNDQSKKFKINYFYNYKTIYSNNRIDSLSKELFILEKNNKSIAESYEKKNEMESYIYKKRGELNEKFKDSVSEEEKIKINDIFNIYEEWLYNHDDSQSTKEFYQKKLNELKDQIEIYYEKYEHEFNSKKKKEIEFHSIEELKKFCKKKEKFADSIILNLNKKNIGDGGGILGYFNDGLNKVKNLLENILINEKLILLLANNNLTDYAIDIIIKILNEHISIKELEIVLDNFVGSKDLNFNNFSKEKIIYFCTNIKFLKNLNSIRIYLEEIDDIGLEKLIESFLCIEKLEKIHLKIRKSSQISVKMMDKLNDLKKLKSSIKENKIELG